KQRRKRRRRGSNQIEMKKRSAKKEQAEKQAKEIEEKQKEIKEKLERLNELNQNLKILENVADDLLNKVDSNKEIIDEILNTNAWINQNRQQNFLNTIKGQ
ncbi:hypothetical protein, partial [Lonepinella sp. BR2357]|uniref:hypothetical protein n=1 Tax=Lonepinella sp. BR2357 TaxID=3434549 RepID=UPI003F6E14A1